MAESWQGALQLNDKEVEVTEDNIQYEQTHWKTLKLPRQRCWLTEEVKQETTNKKINIENRSQTAKEHKIHKNVKQENTESVK